MNTEKRERQQRFQKRSFDISGDNSGEDILPERKDTPFFLRKIDEIP